MEGGLNATKNLWLGVNVHVHWANIRIMIMKGENRLYACDAAYKQLLLNDKNII
jgi:hypothetical protein